MVGERRESGESEAVAGSSARSFLVAFLFTFVVGSLFIVGGLELVGALPSGLAYIVAILGGAAGLSALLARFASFDVAIRVVTSPEGIDATSRGPFGSRQVQHLSWNEIQSVRVLGLNGLCLVKTGQALRYISVTFPQARAIIGHPMFPLRDLPPRVRRRIGLPS
jgi:hypothetical protein